MSPATGLVREVVARTDGVPLFVEELHRVAMLLDLQARAR